MRLGRTALLVLIVALGFSLLGSACGGGDSSAPLGEADRVLVFSVPTLTWEDMETIDLPNLESVLEGSVISNLSVRSVRRRVRPADGYATLGAGTRADGTDTSELAFVARVTRLIDADPDGDPVDVPQEAFVEEQPEGGGVIIAPSPGEDQTVQTPSFDLFAGTPLTEEFARRTGVHPDVGEVFNLGLVAMNRANDRLLFDAEVGSLGEALSDAGHARAVIANADHERGLESLSFRREASAGLMDREGLIDGGRVGRSLLEEAPTSPFGTRYDPLQVMSAFNEFWPDSSVVLLEASDVVRAEDSAEISSKGQYERMRTQALKDSDALLGQMLESIDLSKDSVVVVAPWAAGFSNSVTVFGVRSPGLEGGLLSTGTTRRAGFAQTVDVAPTILSLLDVEVPSSMEGTAAERKGSGGDYDERVTTLVDVSDGAEFRDRTVGMATTVFVVAQIILWLLAIWVLSMRRGSRWQTATEVASLAVLVYLPLTYFAGALPFHAWGSAAYWAFLVIGSALGGLIAYFGFRANYVDPLMAALGLIVVFLSIDIAIGGPLQMNTVFGYTPTVAGRFDGMGNPAFSMFSAAAIMLSALIAHRVGGKRGVWLGIALLGWTILLDGAPWFGADVGGALALVPACAVTAWLLLGRKIKAGTVALWGGVAVAVVVGLGFVDLLRPPSSRTHLGRLLADIGNNGIGAFTTVILRKIDANLSVLVSSVWTLMLPAVFLFIGFLFWKAPWRLKTIEEEIPEERAAVGGLITAMVLGFALNDSGIAVPGMMGGVISASLVYLMLRIDRIVGPAGSDATESDATGSEDSGNQSEDTGEQDVRV